MFSSRSVIHALTVAALVAPFALSAQTPGATRPPRAAKDPMQEGLPLEPSRTLSFTTRVGSWLSVDVSPDAKTLVFDLLGDLCTMPMEGGKAAPLTNSVQMVVKNGRVYSGDTLDEVWPRQGQAPSFYWAAASE